MSGNEVVLNLKSVPHAAPLASFLKTFSFLGSTRTSAESDPLRVI